MENRVAWLRHGPEASPAEQAIFDKPGDKPRPWLSNVVQRLLRQSMCRVFSSSSQVFDRGLQLLELVTRLLRNETNQGGEVHRLVTDDRFAERNSEGIPDVDDDAFAVLRRR